MEIRPTKMFVFRFSEADLSLFVRVLERVLEVGPRPRAFTDAERTVLLGYWRELSRTFDTAFDDEEQEPASPSPAPEEAPRRARPMCRVHQQPMWHQRGKHGWFWSCHERTADGGYCQERPANAAA